MYRVWCEWDMGICGDIYITDNECLFEEEQDIYKELATIDWGMVGYSTWEEVAQEGLLHITKEGE